MSDSRGVVSARRAGHGCPSLIRNTRKIEDTDGHKIFGTMRPIGGCLLLLWAGLTSAFAPSPDTCRSSTALRDAPDFVVMVNGMPGPMATAAAEACLRKGLSLAPIAMTGPDMNESTITVATDARSSNVRLIPSSDIAALEDGLAKLSNVLAIDYTHPSAVNSNAIFYKEHNIPFVMGTTGGDREKLLKDMEGHACVISPNMGKQIVALQTALSQLADQYPAAFKGYKLKVTESHQITKADTSGTAKAVVASLQTLMGNDEPVDIEMIRDEKEAVEFGVPEDALKGHAFHTYTLTSPDGSVQFQLQHNVAGRTIYADGTADAVQFLNQQLDKDPKIYTMMDVLAAGALE